MNAALYAAVSVWLAALISALNDTLGVIAR